VCTTDLEAGRRTVTDFRVVEGSDPNNYFAVDRTTTGEGMGWFCDIGSQNES